MPVGGKTTRIRVEDLITTPNGFTRMKSESIHTSHSPLHTLLLARGGPIQSNSISQYDTKVTALLTGWMHLEQPVNFYATQMPKRNSY